MEIEAVFEQIPFAAELGIEFDEASDGHAEGHLSLRAEHSSNPGQTVAHGGVTYSLADTIGGAAVVSQSKSVSPTIDMRMDYLAPATTNLRAVADVVRFGGSVAAVDIEVYDAVDGDAGEETHVATARGVYKIGGQGEETPWTEGVDLDASGTLDD